MSMLLPKYEVIVAETSETNCLRILNDSLFGGTYVVIVDGIEYRCDDFMNQYSEVCIGDSRLYNESDTSNPIDVPFYVTSYWTDGFEADWLGTWEQGAAAAVYYPDSDTHTIEIKQVIPSNVTGFIMPKHEVVIPATSESNYLYTDNNDGALFFEEGDTCIITVDGVKYTCTAYTLPDWGGTWLGNSVLNNVEGHTENVPFCIVYFCDYMNAKYIHDVGFLYPDSETHTIEIQKVVPSNVIEIKDANGRILWAAIRNVPVVM